MIAAAAAAAATVRRVVGSSLFIRGRSWVGDHRVVNKFTHYWGYLLNYFSSLLHNYNHQLNHHATTSPFIFLSQVCQMSADELTFGINIAESIYNISVLANLLKM